eukprot:TRINITY_DN30572_c1_g1_i3.p1 TRINITY_DN30572_c1_g1~~TRINITY_DN30572_c1_g1_i3.p1  ORF type:complete len:313 (+),score=126.71 TRINITY_DN30572_c1_g1_i3:70-1008(+)
MTSSIEEQCRLLEAALQIEAPIELVPLLDDENDSFEVPTMFLSGTDCDTRLPWVGPAPAELQKVSSSWAWPAPAEPQEMCTEVVASGGVPDDDDVIQWPGDTAEVRLQLSNYLWDIAEEEEEEAEETEAALQIEAPIELVPLLDDEDDSFEVPTMFLSGTNCHTKLPWVWPAPAELQKVVASGGVPEDDVTQWPGDTAEVRLQLSNYLWDIAEEEEEEAEETEAAAAAEGEEVDEESFLVAAALEDDAVDAVAEDASAHEYLAAGDEAALHEDGGDLFEPLQPTATEAPEEDSFQAFWKHWEEGEGFLLCGC